MGFDGPLHLHLLRVAVLSKDLALDSSKFLGFLGQQLVLPGLLLTLLLMMIQAETITLLEELDVLVLGHDVSVGSSPRYQLFLTKAGQTTRFKTALK